MMMRYAITATRTTRTTATMPLPLKLLLLLLVATTVLMLLDGCHATATAAEAVEVEVEVTPSGTTSTNNVIHKTTINTNINDNKSPSASSKGDDDDDDDTEASSSSSSITPVPVVALPNDVDEDTTDTTDTTEEDAQVLRARAIFDWIAAAAGGYVNPKQVVRRRAHTTTSSSTTNDTTDGGMGHIIGIFAADDVSIQEGEILATIPWTFLLKSDNHPNDHGQLPCGTVRALARELRLGNSSHYAPYVDYLLHALQDEEDDYTIPSRYSQAGQELLLQVTTGGGSGPSVVEERIPPVEAVSWIKEDWLQVCPNSDPNDRLSIQAATAVLQRSDDALLIPGYDLYNHRNGKYTNTRTVVKAEEYYQVVASRTIGAGEELYNTYNFCDECGGRKRNYGTPELYRDYGFIEKYPQRWHVMVDQSYQWDIDQDENNKHNGGTVFMEKWHTYPKNADRFDRLTTFLKKDIRRLKRLKNVLYYNRDTKQPATPKDAASAKAYGIPPNEWKAIWEFVDHAIVAFVTALDFLVHTNHYLEERETQPPPQPSLPAVADTYSAAADTNTGSISSINSISGSHYDPWYLEPDDHAYERYTCDTTDAFDMVGFTEIESLKTSYQELDFSARQDTDDLCMSLDNIIQICANYRPHYHEYITHAAGRFVEDVKRIAFIGGGDSMLLHEALKYPNIQKIVGLELDQTVIRKSFQHFHTSPHFEDDRVEWWFGDATKSLLLLPQDYWGSFDLVLVDLSETAMSLSVTKEMDVFDALGLLLNPHGVIVKNEIYFEKFSKVFDYTMELYYESPVICSQVAVLGSNTVDFFHSPVYDHGLENFLYQNLHQDNTRHQLMHDYRRNFAPEEACNIASPEVPTDQTTAAGVVAIVNAEKVSAIKFDAAVIDLIEQVVKDHGLSVLSSHFLFQTGVVVCEEGYIAARMWEEYNYIGLDINLWSKSHTISIIRQALTDALGNTSEDVSDYFVVVGGIFGLDSWKEDAKLLGPKMKQLRNCEDDVVMEGDVSSSVALEVAVEEIVPLALINETVAIVVCGGGDASSSCISRETLSKHSHVTKLVVIEECASLSANASTTLEDFLSCEVEMLDQLEASLDGTTADLVVVDETASFSMHQIVHSILEDDILRTAFLDVHSIIVTWAAEPSQVLWKREFLDRIRKAVEEDPASRSEIVVQAGGKTYELGIVSTDNDRANFEYDRLEQRMKSRLSISPYHANVELRLIHGSMFNYEEELTTHFFKLEDYDLSAARQQYHDQVPLGRQSIFQFGRKDRVSSKTSESVLSLSLSEVSTFLTSGLADIDMGLSTNNKQFAVGDGGVVLSIGSFGNVIAVWDGRSQVVVNFFTLDQSEEIAKRFVKNFHEASRSKLLQLQLRDDQPRGFHRVINFAQDLPAEAAVER